MKELTEAYRRFSDERDWGQFHTPENLAKSICIEAGELLECFQWSDDLDREHLCEELADVFSYCIMLADSIGADLKEITLAKLEKTKAKYPVDRARGVSTKYDKLLAEAEKKGE
jgi:NTP pyrophosphatase (non-canonical NTP hydrolase)